MWDGGYVIKSGTPPGKKLEVEANEIGIILSVPNGVQIDLVSRDYKTKFYKSILNVNKMTRYLTCNPLNTYFNLLNSWVIYRCRIVIASIFREATKEINPSPDQENDLVCLYLFSCFLFINPFYKLLLGVL